MKALRFTGNRLHLDDIPIAECGGDVLVRVVKSGICNTDLEIIRGYAGFSGTLGHEFVGVVESESPLRGRRVTGEINAGCGACDLCAGRVTRGIALIEPFSESSGATDRTLSFCPSPKRIS